jgi:uncharacterized RDD family membrane protein YckC
MFCHNCNTESGITLFCHVCDRYLPATGVGVRAGVARRVAAIIVDLVINVAVIIVAFRLVVLFGTNSQPSSDSTLVLTVAFAIDILFLIAMVKTFAHGQTIGKWLLSIRAVDKRNGENPGLGRMLVRETLGKFLSGFFFSLGYFWAIWDINGQGWHDKISGTVVAYEASGDNELSNTRRVAGGWPIAAICSAILLGFIAFGYQASEQRVAPEGRSALAAQSTSNRYISPVEVDSSGPPKTAQAVIPTETSPTRDEGDARSADSSSEIAQTLSAWASAFESNDAVAEASFYGEAVDRYFLTRNTTRSAVLADKQRFLDSGQRIESFEI